MGSSKLDRREFLELSAGAAAGALLTRALPGCDQAADAGGPGFDPQQYPDVGGAFPIGVQASEADSSSILLSSKLSPEWLEGGELEVAVYAPGGETLHFQGPAAVDEAGFVRVEVEDLKPGREHRYVFLKRSSEGEVVERSPEGRFVTLPAPDALVPLTFGASACTSRMGAPWNSFLDLASREPDLHLLLGDTCYADAAVSLDEYRAEWAYSFGSPSYRALRASTGIYATWDDHEVANNWARWPDDSPPPAERFGQPSFVGPSRLEAATQAFKEHVGLRQERLWRRIRWGKTAEFFILDCRSERDTDQEIYLSRAQMDWLKSGLEESDAHWKFIVNSVPILSWPNNFNAFFSDTWHGYPTQRAEILDHIEGRIAGVVWLSGDFHMGMVARMSADPEEHPTQHDVLIGHGGSFANPLAGGAMDVNPTGQFLAASNEPGYALLELNPEQRPDELRIRYVGNGGQTLFDVRLPRSPGA